MLSRRTILRLGDMVGDADRLAGYVDGLSLADFLADERTVLAVERLLQRITEATIQMDAADAMLIDDIPFAKMRAFGNLLRHEYRDIDRSVVFDVARVEVPPVRAAAARALASDAG